MPRDRDDRQTSAPLPGSELALLGQEVASRRQFARPGTPVQGVDVRSVTEKIAERSKRAADHSEAAVSGITEIRNEFGDRIGALEVVTANMDGKLDVLLTTLPAALQTHTMTVTTKLELDKAEGMTKLEVAKADALEAVKAKESKREIAKAWWVAGATLLVAAGGFVATLVQKC